jgi:hypothetical protein
MRSIAMKQKIIGSLVIISIIATLTAVLVTSGGP